MNNRGFPQTTNICSTVSYCVLVLYCADVMLCYNDFSVHISLRWRSLYYIFESNSLTFSSQLKSIDKKPSFVCRKVS